MIDDDDWDGLSEDEDDDDDDDDDDDVDRDEHKIDDEGEDTEEDDRGSGWYEDHWGGPDEDEEPYYWEPEAAEYEDDYYDDELDDDRDDEDDAVRVPADGSETTQENDPDRLALIEEHISAIGCLVSAAFTDLLSEVSALRAEVAAHRASLKQQFMLSDEALFSFLPSGDLPESFSASETNHACPDEDDIPF